MLVHVIILLLAYCQQSEINSHCTIETCDIFFFPGPYQWKYESISLFIVQYVFYSGNINKIQGPVRF